MAQNDIDRNEKATPHKLLKAREQGQVAKSPDVVAAAVFLAAMVYLSWRGPSLWASQIRFDRQLLLQAQRPELGLQGVATMLGRMLGDTLVAGAPFFATLAIAAILGNLVQTGPLLSFEPVKAKLERANPVEGFKRLFSLRTLFVALRSVLKLCLLSLVACFALKSLLPQFYRLSGLSSLGALKGMLDDLASLGLKLAAMQAVIALLDLLYVRREFAKKMRMSRRELKDESRNREGDPRIRARLRELRRDLLKRSLSLKNTRHADVLVTNPTHIAIALRYDHATMASPEVIAKGRGFMAAAMRKIAARHRVPVVQSPSLARALYRDVGVAQPVRPHLYTQVARIIVWVMAQREGRGARPRAGATRGGAAWAR